MIFEIDTIRFEEVLNALYSRYLANKYPYYLANVKTPQDSTIIPDDFKNRGTRDNRLYARYLFFLCLYMRGKIGSVFASKGFTKLYQAHPDWFDAFVASRLKVSEIEAGLRKAGLGSGAVENARSWSINAKRLVRDFNGEALQIVEGVEDYREACVRIRNQKSGRGFRGFQEKMVSMILYFYLDAGLIEEFNFPMPVDFHVLRVLISNEAVRYPVMPDRNDHLSKELLLSIREQLMAYTASHDVNLVKLCNAVWLLSESQCSNAPGNRAIPSKERNGRSTVIFFPPVTGSLADHHAYGRTCAPCPLVTTCTLNIPSAPYYLWGGIYPSRKTEVLKLGGLELSFDMTEPKLGHESLRSRLVDGNRPKLRTDDRLNSEQKLF
jgi:hypothetical protein